MNKGNPEVKDYLSKPQYHPSDHDKEILTLIFLYALKDCKYMLFGSNNQVTAGRNQSFSSSRRLDARQGLFKAGKKWSIWRREAISPKCRREKDVPSSVNGEV